MRSRALFRLWSLLVIGLLLTSLGLGWLASGGTMDRNLHGLVAFVAAGMAIASHMRHGSGWDFLAVVALVGAVGLGLMVQGGGVSPHLHLALALPAALLSAGVHLGQWRGPSRTMAAGQAMAEERER